MDKFLRHRINVGRATVREHVSFFRKQFGRVVSEWKEDHSRVTFADFAISEKISAELQRCFPEDDICTEEGDPNLGIRDLNARYAWVLDPIDGTNNFAIGMPYCGISLGLLKDGLPIYGFLYDYSRDSLIEGGPGHGLKDGENVVPAMEQRKLEEKTIIGLTFPLKEPYLQQLHPIVGGLHVRSIGSGALTLAYVALGFIDGCIDFRSKSWDVAAAQAFIGAVGGKMCYLDNSLFPLKRFDVRQKAGPFYAGTDDFCALCEKLMGR